MSKTRLKLWVPTLSLATLAWLPPSLLGGNYSASPIFADGHLYIPSREGLTTVVQPGKSYQALATNALPGKIMATPAAVDGALFFRTDTALYRSEE